MQHLNVWKGTFFTLCVAGFCLIAYFVTQDATSVFDESIQNWIFSLRNDALTTFFIPLTYSGNWQTVTLVCLILLLFPKTRKAYGIPLTFSALLSLTLYELLKFIFQRPRPDISFHLISQGGYSFPSGHSLTAFVVWGTLILLLHAYANRENRPRKVIHKTISSPQHGENISSPQSLRFPHLQNKKTVFFATVLIGIYIFLMGISRIYLGVHYPTDVLGSWLLGGGILVTLDTYCIPFLAYISR